MKYIIIILFLVGCSSGGSPAPTADQGQEVGSGEDCVPKDMPVVVFQDVQQEVINVSCVFCHSDQGGNPGAVNLENFSSVFQNRIASKAAIDSGRMPKPPISINDDQKNLFAAWLNIGAPENEEQIDFCEE